MEVVVSHQQRESDRLTSGMTIVDSTSEMIG